MSAPFLDHDDPLHGALSELVSAQSSLNTYADPIPGATGYISETDASVKHAMEHIHAAFELVNRAFRDRDTARSKFYRMQLKLAEKRPSERCAAYVASAAALLALDRQGLGESNEAEALRDSMDVQWYLMPESDQGHARAMVAVLGEQFESAGHDPGDEAR